MVSTAKRVRTSDMENANVILDFADKKVVKCLIEGKPHPTDFDKMKVGSKFKFVGLIVDVNQIYSPLCLEFESSDGLKILVKYDEVFDTDDNGSGVSYPSSYYTYNITVNFYINVNIYR